MPSSRLATQLPEHRSGGPVPRRRAADDPQPDRRKKLKASRVGRRIVITPASLTKFLEANEV
jgi:hypothetical protein